MNQDYDGTVTISILGLDGYLPYSLDNIPNTTAIATKTLNRADVATNPVHLDVPISAQTKENVVIEISGTGWNHGQVGYLKVYLA